MNEFGPPTASGAYRSPRPSLQVEIPLPCTYVLGKIDGVQLSAWHLFLCWDRGPFWLSFSPPLEVLCPLRGVTGHPSVGCPSPERRSRDVEWVTRHWQIVPSLHLLQTPKNVILPYARARVCVGNNCYVVWVVLLGLSKYVWKAHVGGEPGHKSLKRVSPAVNHVGWWQEGNMAVARRGRRGWTQPWLHRHQVWAWKEGEVVLGEACG